MAVTSHTLRICFPFDGTVERFDDLMDIEELLVQGYRQNRSARVDGHDVDVGGGEYRIFIIPTPGVGNPIEVAVAYLRRRPLGATARVEKHYARSGRVELVWDRGAWCSLGK